MSTLTARTGAPPSNGWPADGVVLAVAVGVPVVGAVAEGEGRKSVEGFAVADGPDDVHPLTRTTATSQAQGTTEGRVTRSA